MTSLNRLTVACTLSLLCTATAYAGPKAFNILGNFDNKNGSSPEATLLQSGDGTLYGTTIYGGSSTSCPHGCGTVFKLTPSGPVTIYSFSGTDGSSPYAGLTQGADGNFYGATISGGNTIAQLCPSGCGTLFELTPAGSLTTLYKFSFTDGANPMGTLLLAADGNFYGEAGQGGQAGNGTLFKMTPSGTLSTIWNFDFGNYGVDPSSGLIEGPDGDLYGATEASGKNGGGEIFKFSARGRFTIVHSFNDVGKHGIEPAAALVLGRDGNFYGTTLIGGRFQSYGEVFKMTPAGVVTSLHSFDVTDGDIPTGILIQGVDGAFYGTTNYGGHGDFGTIFKVTSAGVFTKLHNFNSTKGSYPYGGLLQGADGLLYGTTSYGGTDQTDCSYGCGTVFSLSLGQ
jgi:uncharacterized repeat protein (TIGR03803 family)